MALPACAYRVHKCVCVCVGTARCGVHYLLVYFRLVLRNTDYYIILVLF